jgi:hypothetical protein
MQRFPDHIKENFPMFCQRVEAASGLARLPSDFTFSKIRAYADCIPVLVLDNNGMQSLPLSPTDSVWTWEVLLDDTLVYAWALNKTYINRPPSKLTIKC